MHFNQLTGMALAVAFGLSSVAGAAELTPEKRAEFSAKAETASRLIAYGQARKDPDMLRAAAKLIGEIGPVAREVKDGKPVNHEVEALLTEAAGYGNQSTATSNLEAKPNQCSWFYNCDSYNNCFWDQWC